MSAADFDAWREPLLASLRDCGAQPAPRFAVLRYGLAMAAMTLSVSVVPAFFTACAHMWMPT